MANLALDTGNSSPGVFPRGGYLLDEAIKKFTAPEAWEAYERAAAKASGLRRSAYFVDAFDEPIAGWDAFYDGQRDNALIDKMEHAWAPVRDAFISKLLSGELIACGIHFPLQPDSAPVWFPTDHWRLLVPNFKNSTAEGAGATYLDVHVYHSEQIKRISGESLPAVSGSPKPEAPKKRGKAGRPGYIRAAKAELKRRAADGEILESKWDELAYIVYWVKKHYPRTADSCEEWIRKQLGRVYDELMKGKKRA